MSIRVSVVIPTYKRPDYLERCVRALLTQELPAKDFEIIIVDAAASDFIRQEVQQWATQAAENGYTIRYLAGSKKARGPAAARNHGWQASQAEIVAFTDDDCIPEQRWLQMGLNAFQEDVACVSGRVVVPLRGVPTEYEYTVGKRSKNDFMTASCFYLRTALEQMGGFTIPSYEDQDLFFSLLEHNYKCIYIHEAAVMHPIRPVSWGISLYQQHKYMFNTLLSKKHRQLYRQRLQTPFAWRDYCIVWALLIAVLSALCQVWLLSLLACFVWLLMTVLFCLQRLYKTSHAPAQVLEIAITSLLIPPLATFWRLSGIIIAGIPPYRSFRIDKESYS
jgi:cellulose synthase/poly-beta-1,6-N-acetylglucosamine synthase-like glycosyltransferase